MKKLGILTVVLLCLIFVLQCTASASAKWIYVQRLEGTRKGSCSEYLETGSVTKNGPRLVYWTLWVLDEPGGNQQVRKILWKNEALLSEPKQVRALETYQYDGKGVEVYQYLKPTVGSKLVESSAAYQALQYANENSCGEPAKPTDIDVLP